MTVQDSLAEENVVPLSLKIGDKAPDFLARTTMGPLTLSSLRGRWVVLFSHPADFTPVCTSEFMAFSAAAEQFEALNCALLGLSVDSLPSHLAWVEAIRVQFGIRIPFPIIEDPSLAIARAYGMLDPAAESSATVRAVYVLCPEGIIRAIIWYPSVVGRSVSETLRLLQALQAVETQSVMTPEGWQPGDRLLAIPPETQQAAEQSGPEWFLQFVEAEH